MEADGVRPRAIQFPDAAHGGKRRPETAIQRTLLPVGSPPISGDPSARVGVAAVALGCSRCFAPAPIARFRGLDASMAWCRSCHNGPSSATRMIAARDAFPTTSNLAGREGSWAGGGVRT